MGVTSANANGGVLQLKSGITFPATAVASTDANTLDDYEEGTWTPSVGGTATYTTQEARYTKIGRMVHASLYLVINTIGTGSTIDISGLPFTPGNDTGGGSFSYWFGTLTAVNSLIGYIYSATTIYMYSTASASSTIVQNGILKNGAAVQGHFSYFV